MPKVASQISAIEAAKTVRGAVAGLNATKRSLEAERAELKQRTEVLLSLPVRRADAKQFIFDAVDRIGAEFPRLGLWGRVFEVYAYPRGGGREERPDGKAVNPYARGAPLSLRDIEQVASSAGMQGLTGVIGGSDSMDFFSGGGSLTPASTARAFFFFGEAIKSKIDAHFDELFPHFNAGQLEEEGTVSERRAEIARNRLRVDVIDEEISALQGQLSELGTAGRPE